MTVVCLLTFPLINTYFNWRFKLVYIGVLSSSYCLSHHPWRFHCLLSTWPVLILNKTIRGEQWKWILYPSQMMRSIEILSLETQKGKCMPMTAIGIEILLRYPSGILFTSQSIESSFKYDNCSIGQFKIGSASMHCH